MESILNRLRDDLKKLLKPQYYDYWPQLWRVARDAAKEWLENQDPYYFLIWDIYEYTPSELLEICQIAIARYVSNSEELRWILEEQGEENDG